MARRDPITLFRSLARMHVRAQRAAIACRATSETHCIMLTEIGRATELPMSELVSRLQLDKGWVSRAVDQLVQEGLVSRSAHQGDRRVVVVRLTEAGTKRFRDVDKCLNVQLERVFARLSHTDRGNVAAALALLHDAYSAETAERARASSGRTAAA